MEQHIERLIAACGLAHFGYRLWPAPTIDAPHPRQPVAVASVTMAVAVRPSAEPAAIPVSPAVQPRPRPSGLIELPSPEAFDRRAGIRAVPAEPPHLAEARRFALLVEMTEPAPPPGIPRDRRAPAAPPRPRT